MNASAFRDIWARVLKIVRAAGECNLRTSLYYEMHEQSNDFLNIANAILIDLID